MLLLVAASQALPQFPRASLQPLDAEPFALGLSSLLAPLWERTSLADQRRAGLLGGRVGREARTASPSNYLNAHALWLTPYRCQRAR